jgi:metal-responsive CopG/Arc/MetJ family transcriptional regulator
MKTPTKHHRIVVTLPASVLKDLDWLAPLEDMTRDELILAAIKCFLKPHLEIRRQVLKAAANPGKLHGPFDTVEEFVSSLHKEDEKLHARKNKRPPRITKAISESTKDLKTGRYEV